MSSAVAPSTNSKEPEDKLTRARSEIDRYEATRSEVLRSAKGTTIQERDVDAVLGILDQIAYYCENALVASPAIKYYMLMLITMLIMLVLSWMWTLAVDLDTERADTSTYSNALFLVFTVFAGSGIKADMVDNWERLVYSAIVFSGLIIFAVLVGFITDSVSAFIENMTEGRTKVAATGHTLILGWNQSTIRVVCQIAFLRRQYMIQNETCLRRLFPWTRADASTPLACNPVMIVTDRHEKVWMDEQLQAGLLSRGIMPSRTRVGWDVVCRSGDPCDVHDLIRVSAQSATSILVMMTDDDNEENAQSNGKLFNASSLRCLMALRHVLYADASDAGWLNDGHRRRIVVQTSTEAQYFGDIFHAPDDKPVVLPLDLSIFVNTLMFKCASKPGLSFVLLSLLNFEDEAIRCRAAQDLCAGDHGMQGALTGMTVGQAILSANWQQSVMVGVTPADPTMFDPQYHGIIADPEYVLKPTDLVIFVSKTSMPKPSLTPSLFSCLPAPDKEAGSAAKQYTPRANKDPIKVLLCGWRERWSQNPKRVRQRIKDLGLACAPQRTEITFLNMFDSAGFEEQMAAIKDCDPAEGPVMRNPSKPEEGFEWNGGLSDTLFVVHLNHVHGDAANYDDMNAVLKQQSFDVAIVLGTQVEVGALPAKLQDSRVLTICMLLRHLSPPDCPMRVVSENNDDQTALLAVAPTSNTSDFVNTQAIIARALAMNLAYPRLNAATVQLFKTEDLGKFRTPEIDLLEVAGIPAICGRSCTFGEVQQAVRNCSESGSIVAFGYFLNGEGMKMVLAPEMAAVRTWDAGDKIVVFQRNKTTQQNFSVLDLNGDGFVERAEWIATFSDIDGFEEFAQGDGKISVAEFASLREKQARLKAKDGAGGESKDDISLE